MGQPVVVLPEHRGALLAIPEENAPTGQTVAGGSAHDHMHHIVYVAITGGHDSSVIAHRCGNAMIDIGCSVWQWVQPVCHRVRGMTVFR